MPYSMNNLPPQCKGMTDAQKGEFIKVCNAMLKGGAKEDVAIPTAIKKAKEFSEDFFEGQWVEVFRAGKQTDSAGNTRTWTEKDLDTIVAKYNAPENQHEAPVVVGHPKDNAPAFGWVEKLKQEGGVLYAQFNQLVPEFVDAVKAGMYKKRSISLYNDLTLRHIGFLGAVPPAVKGLKDIKFEESEDFSDYEFEDKKGETKMPGTDKTVEERIAALETSFKEKTDAMQKTNDDLTAANKVLTDKIAKFEEEKAAADKAAADAAAAAAANHSEEDPAAPPECGKGKGKPKKSEFEEKADERIKALETQLAIAEKKTRIGEYKEYVQDLHSKGQIVSDCVNQVVDLMEALHSVGKAEFSEDDKKVEKEVIDAFKAYLEKQPKVVEMGETNTNAQKQKAAQKASEQLSDKATAIMNEKKCSYSEALAAAQEQNPELTQQAFAEIE